MSDAVVDASDEEVILAFEEFVQERSNSGVLFAKAVVSIMFDGSAVLAIFDPLAAGAEEEAFLALNPFETLAQFIGTPMVFANAEGQRLRTRVTAISVALSSGRDLGSLSVADLYRAGTGQEWKPGD